MIILCADDYALSPGVSRGILELCAVRRLSATSALVTGNNWPDDATRLQQIRSLAAIGLHLNLTLGTPLVPHRSARHLDNAGRFLPISKLIIASLTRRLDAAALQQECSAQIAAFQDATGTLPDFIDGHQHVHALPVVRQALIAAIKAQGWTHPPLVRRPASTATTLALNPMSPSKETVVAWLTTGFRASLINADLPFNTSFAGFSAFSSAADYRTELEAALDVAKLKYQSTQPCCHLIMCHPGHIDEQLRASGDPVIERRQDELDAILAYDGLPDRIWHPQRDNRGAIDWRHEMTT